MGRIIGKGGSNVKDLQRSTNAVIKLPEQVNEENNHQLALNSVLTFDFLSLQQGSPTGDETPVHINGIFYSVQVCRRKI